MEVGFQGACAVPQAADVVLLLLASRMAKSDIPREILVPVCP